jgi:hypothetical protein
MVDGGSTEQGLDESAFAAAQVQHSRGRSTENSSGHSIEAPLVQADAFLDLTLLVVLLLVDLRLVVRRVISEAGQDVARERTPVLQVAATDQLASGMGRQPRAALVEQLASLVLADPVVLVVVEHRQQHVEMRQQVGEPHPARETDRQVPTGAPGRELVIEGEGGRLDLVAEGLEQRPQHRLAASDRQHRHLDLERERGVGERRPLVAAPRHRRAEHLAHHDAQERRRHVGPVVHVAREGERLLPLPASTAHQPDRIDLDHHRRGAAPLPRFGEEHVSIAERERDRAHVLGVLVQQVPEVGRRGVAGGDREEHRDRRGQGLPS